MAAAEAFAERVATEDDVKRLTIDQLTELQSKVGQECIYLLDVRTEQEFAAGHIPGFSWFPGGQAVQRSDDTVAVHDATIVFCCTSEGALLITASWYRQLGFPNVYAVDGGTAAWTASGRALQPGTDQPGADRPGGGAGGAGSSALAELEARLAATPNPLVLFVDTSREFASGHLPGSRWLSRSWLELRIGALAADPQTPIVVTDVDGLSAPSPWRRLASVATATSRCWLVGCGPGGGGLPLETGLSGVMSPPTTSSQPAWNAATPT